MPEPRRFPPPWSIDETSACFIVRDGNMQAVTYVYCKDEAGRRTTAKLLTRDEAHRIAANIAKLPDLLKRPTGATNAAVLAICERVAEMQAMLHDYLEAGTPTTAADCHRQGAGRLVGARAAARDVRCRLLPAEHAAGLSRAKISTAR